ncbi:MAG: hypothetical protein D6723_16865 [Acidobacteria bacterium]|nr:MAG: hypothetical protein D6723_16865 [Acidobacteriota bacterium]
MSRLEAAGVGISVDGRGRVFDNVFVERLWRTVKYEEVYQHEYESVRAAWQRLDESAPKATGSNVTTLSPSSVETL